MLKNTLQQLVQRLLAPSIDDCLTQFSKLKAKLAKVQERHIALSDAKTAFAEQLRAEADAHEDEVHRASRIIGKLENLLG